MDLTIKGRDLTIKGMDDKSFGGEQEIDGRLIDTTNAARKKYITIEFLGDILKGCYWCWWWWCDVRRWWWFPSSAISGSFRHLHECNSIISTLNNDGKAQCSQFDRSWISYAKIWSRFTPRMSDNMPETDSVVRPLQLCVSCEHHIKTLLRRKLGMQYELLKTEIGERNLRKCEAVSFHVDLRLQIYTP